MKNKQCDDILCALQFAKEFKDLDENKKAYLSGYIQGLVQKKLENNKS